jgi:DNA-binding transcriptional ArsR family regulator
VFNTNNDYASTAVELPFMLRKGFNKLYKQGRKKDYPELAIDLLCVLICRTQKINQQNDECNPIKLYESSTRELANKVGVHQTTIQRNITWLFKKGWIKSLQCGKNDKRKTLYELNVGKINGLIKQYGMSNRTQ